MTALLVSLAGCSGGVLQPEGPIGAADTKILLNALGIMLAIVVPTIVAALAIAWWFRASNTRARYLPDWVYSGRIELLTWGIPLLVILFLGGVIWLGAHELDPYKPIASLGISVSSGMIASTLLAVVFVPSFFVVLKKLDERRKKRPAPAPTKAGAAPAAAK